MKSTRAAWAASLVLAATSALAQGKLPFVDAEVRKLDTANGTIVLKHKDIPNLGMMGMTMQFDVADKKLLAGVKPGDKVRFTADMVDSRAVVQQLRAVK